MKFPDSKTMQKFIIIGWVLLVAGGVGATFVKSPLLILFAVAAILGFVFLIVGKLTKISTMNRMRKLINIIGVFIIAGVLLGIMGVSLYNLSQHWVTGSDKKNIKRNIQLISKNEKNAKEMLGKIYKEFESFKTKNNHFPYDIEEIDAMQFFSPYSRILKTTVRQIDGYLFNVSSSGYFWFCYTWPKEYGITGVKSYYIDNNSPKIKWTERKFSGIKNSAKNKDAEYWRY